MAQIGSFRKVMMTPGRIHCFLTMILGVWVVSIITAPMLVQSGNRILQMLGTGIYIFLDPVCHQLPDRSLFWDALPFPVCSRCLFIYLGGFLVMLVSFHKKARGYWSKYTYLAIGLLVGAEMFTEKILIIQTFIELRVVSGFLMGVLIFRLALESTFLTGENHTNG